MSDSVFKDCTAEERRIIEGMPTFTNEELTAANDLFDHYLFYRTEKGGRRFWTSCCGKAGYFIPRYEEIMQAANYDISFGKHNDTARCPFCGRLATIKCIGKIGRAVLLNTYRPVVFLRSRGNALYAEAHVLEKCYDARGCDTDCLTNPPRFFFAAAYRFMPGSAMQVTKGCYDKRYHCNYEQGTLGKKKHVTEPFPVGGGMYMHYENYHVIGIEALRGAFAKYCQYENWRRLRNSNAYGYIAGMHTILLSYLTAYAVYPRQVEMLVKAGMSRPIADLLFERKKNAKVLDWRETDPRKAFGLSGQELKQVLTAKRDGNEKFQALVWRKDLLRTGDGVTMGQLLSSPEGWRLPELLSSASQYNDYKRLFALCKTCGVTPSRLCRYLEKHTGPRCYGGYFGIPQAWQLWRDTLTMAEQLGFDVTDSAVSMPSNLEGKHQEYIDLINQQRKIARANQDRAEKKKLQDRREKLEKKYAFTLGGLLVRVPAGEAEIQEEGKILKHCVAGYASRHVEGYTTILFLRQEDAPDTPFCTIEMRDNTIVQIHGYKNEGIHSPGGRFAPDPRKVHKEFLDTWLAWLKAGSKRDKLGRPVLPKTKTKEAKTA